MRRVILGIGLQDVLVAGLAPCTDIEILGASSDHLLIDAKEQALKVGDEVEFNLNYGALLSAMTSPYVAKRYFDGSRPSPRVSRASTRVGTPMLGPVMTCPDFVIRPRR